MSDGLCVIGRDDRMGLGSMTADFCGGMPVDRLILIDGDKRPGKIDFPKPADTRHVRWASLRDLPFPPGTLDGMRTVVGFETWYSDRLTEDARKLGIKTVLMPMHEWSSAKQASLSDCLIALSETDYDWCLGLPQRSPCRLLRTDWPAMPRPEPAKGFRAWPPKKFVHVAGNAVHNREGTREVLAASERLIGTGARLIVHSSFDCRGWLTNPKSPVEFRGSVKDRCEMYDGMDCMVQPRRLSGHSLPINEAAGEGLPTIVLDLPDWKAWTYRVGRMVESVERYGPLPQKVYTADVGSLGLLMRQMALGEIGRQPTPAMPTWEQFRRWWETNV